MFEILCDLKLRQINLHAVIWILRKSCLYFVAVCLSQTYSIFLHFLTIFCFKLITNSCTAVGNRPKCEKYCRDEKVLTLLFSLTTVKIIIHWNSDKYTCIKLAASLWYSKCQVSFWRRKWHYRVCQREVKV